MSLVTDFRILRSPTEIEAFFWRIAPFIDAKSIRASVEHGPALTRIGSYEALVDRAGRTAAEEEITHEIARASNGRGLPQLILLPSGSLSVMRYFGRLEQQDKEKPAETIIRMMVCPAAPDQAAPMLAALAQALLGLRDSVGDKPGRAPLRGRREMAWPEAVAALFTRDAVEAAYNQLAEQRERTGVQRLTSRHRDVVEAHVRWFAERRKDDGESLAREKAATSPPKRKASPAMRNARTDVDMKLHIINMLQGELSDRGYFQTTESDVARIAAEARDWIAAGDGRRLVVYAHGGLVSEEEAINYARDTVGWWLENDVYPVFCIWESDALTSILQLVRESLGGDRRGPFDWGEMRDAAIERLVHLLGQQVWDVIKRSAARCSADGRQFGLTLFAATLKQVFGSSFPPIDLVGHSAGSILHLAFLARLRAEKIPVKTFQTLAPAASCRLYADGLAAHGDELKTRIYAMQDRFERDDNVMGLYGKSLLYLVSRGFEEQFGEAISGLQKDLLADRRLVGLLSGWSGGVTREALVFSPTPPDAPKRLRSGAISHGAFDTDPETMWSVMALIHGEGDPDKIPEFPKLEDSAHGKIGRGPGRDLPEEVRTYLALARSGVPAGGASPVNAAPLSALPAEARQGRKLALTIGINDYDVMNRLQGCVNDSNIWRDLLLAQGYNVTQLIRGEETGRDQITRQLRDFVGQSAPGDTLVWHFSGHGMEIEGVVGNDNDAEIRGVDQAIVAANASETLTGQLSHAIMDDELHAILQGVNQQAACYVFLDSCFSGSATRFSVRGRKRSLGTLRMAGRSGRGRGLTAPMNPGIRSAYDGTGHVLFSACSATQTAMEDGTPPQGLFTRAVRDLLQNPDAALSNANFCLRVNELIPGNDQTPGLYCDPSRRDLAFPLAGR
ncbi:caspase family protein [uncultured Paracoccus sp.]|uniref:caspase family protein n=1 Tax=uncultured Paracoccus sp. TaxID=189685 RepID=UPI00261F51C9|nr:caspase family protein [uncultured Paracoccus sp.]